MILGPACSEATELMGEIAQRFMNIPQVWHHTIAHMISSVKIFLSLNGENSLCIV